jgi:bifunctional UDP-N-acetylglucosamine pyrophosphorylase/glucosamine-1-phosphate N-acetyltransferase
VVILAAGKGTRMKSARAKVLHAVAGTPMIDYVIDAAGALSPASVTVVVGHQADAVRTAVAARPGVRFALQEPQRGTAHALLAAEPALSSAHGTVVLLSGDVPLLTPGSLRGLVAHHHDTGASVTVLSTVVEDARGYGRMVRSAGRLARIVEEKDATADERALQEINSGIYALSLDGLFDDVRAVGAENAQREYYLPDLVAVRLARGLTVETVCLPDASEVLGVNSRRDLADLSLRVWKARNLAAMDGGVTLMDPASTFLGRGVTIGPDTIIHPHVTIDGPTSIGEGCEIRSGVRIAASQIADRVNVLDYSIIVNSRVGTEASVGPFTHLRDGVTILEQGKVGNFVEMKKTVFGRRSKAMHLSYLGDAQIGANVNIGAGTITCNYDGARKQRTVIADNAFIGSDTQLIAPVEIGENAYVGTGTTVREDVPGGALAVSAGRQRTIPGWVAKKGRTKT